MISEGLILCIQKVLYFLCNHAAACILAVRIAAVYSSEFSVLCLCADGSCAVKLSAIAAEKRLFFHYYTSITHQPPGAKALPSHTQLHNGLPAGISQAISLWFT